MSFPRIFRQLMVWWEIGGGWILQLEKRIGQIEIVQSPQSAKSMWEENIVTASRQREGSLLYSAGVLDIQSPHLLSNCPQIGLQSCDCHTLVRGQDTRLHKQLPRTEYGSILGGGGETEYLGGLALGKIVLSTFGEEDIIKKQQDMNLEHSMNLQCL